MEKLIIHPNKQGGIQLVFLFILIIMLLCMLILIFSKIQIQIENFKFNSQTARHINKDYKIIIKLYILGCLPIFKINVTKAKLEKIKWKEKIKKVDFQIIEKKNFFKKEIREVIQKVDFSIKNINLSINLGTQNSSLTAIIVPVISTVIAIFLRKKINKLENQTFIVHPIYQNQNLVNIYFSGIFEIKMRHIINVIYVLNKKGVKRYERTSNRRSYDYGYE